MEHKAWVGALASTRWLLVMPGLTKALAVEALATAMRRILEANFIVGILLVFSVACENNDDVVYEPIPMVTHAEVEDPMEHSELQIKVHVRARRTSLK